MNFHQKLLASISVVFLFLGVAREFEFRKKIAESRTSIIVSVTGDVRSPGLVRLPSQARRVHAVEACGGLARRGDLSGLDLARRLSDGENLHIDLLPKPEHLADSQGLEAKPIARRPVAERFPERSAWQPGIPLDLNACTLEELESIPGIGPKLAQKILQRRAEQPQQCFRRLEDLAAIRGISSKTIARLSPHLKIEGP